MLQRQMYSGLDFINYNLYTSNDYSNVWGDGTNGSSIQSGSFASGPKNRNYIIYARISALDQSNIAVGTYSDNISINVTYN
jgi:spore coat protein U-like protein